MNKGVIGFVLAAGLGLLAFLSGDDAKASPGGSKGTGDPEADAIKLQGILDGAVAKCKDINSCDVDALYAAADAINAYQWSPEVAAHAKQQADNLRAMAKDVEDAREAQGVAQAQKAGGTMGKAGLDTLKKGMPPKEADYPVSPEDVYGGGFGGGFGGNFGDAFGDE